MNNTSSPDLIYVYGSGRSGTTLFTNLLDLKTGFIGIGELNRGFYHLNKKCSCGKVVSYCLFWNQVISSIEVDLDLDSSQFHGLLSNMEKKRFFLLSIIGLRKKHFIQYKKFNRKLIKCLKLKSNNRIPIDSSKNIMRYFLLQRSLLKINVTHIIRNPRAVLISNINMYSRVNMRKSKSIFRFKCFLVLYALISWNITNMLGFFMRFKNNSYTLVKYENLANNPEKQINLYLKKINLEIHQNNLVSESHIIYGNRMTYNFAIDNVKIDKEWQKKFKWYHELILQILTFPTIWLYGYGKKNNKKHHTD